MSRPITAVAALVVLVGLLATCSRDSPTAPRGASRLTVLLTDAPTDEASKVVVYVSGLTLKRSGELAARVATDLGLFDLLALQGTTAELIALGVDPGTYEFVQIDLDQSQSYVVEKASGSSVPLRIASQEVKVLSGFTVPEGGDTVVTLDFDAAASLQHLGNGDWLMTPIVTQVSPPPG